MAATYMQVLAEYFPKVQASIINGNDGYEDLIWLGGDALPSKEVLEPLILKLTQTQMWLKIQAERDRRKASGTPVGNYWFHSDDTSRIQQLGLLMMGQNMPSGIMWKTMSGQFVLMTPTLASQIFLSTATHDIATFTAAEQHKAAMMQLQYPETYDFSGNWPKVYGE